MPYQTLPICDKDEALISCRKVILRLLDARGAEVPAYLKTYATSVVATALDVLDPHAVTTARKEE